MIRRLGLLLIALQVWGCSTGTDLGPVTQEQVAAASAASVSPQLQPGDKISVTVFGEDKLSGDFEINPGGLVSLPLAGTVKAAGLTQSQLEIELARKFRGEYLRNPKVTVTISAFRPIYIVGEVVKPGEHAYKNGLNVLMALAIAGGTTYRGSRTTVLIQRAGETGMREYPMEASVPVLPGDLIRVPMRYF